ncbi:MAG: tryptophan synthase subunit alpha, partial [Eggerthellaceae bacterium]|nr:tryptophan synthase subunit alpha [Eggerthellaceae bacterium]
MSNESVKAAFEGHKAFIPFITCGDPDPQTTEELARALKEAGASIIELGIPFSDPTAEGPVIQQANIRSLEGGTTTDTAFEVVEALRAGDPDAGIEPLDIPIMAMTYGNVVFHYGIERFCERAKEAGLDGIILPDVPYEEKEEFAQTCRDYDLAYISLIAPTSDDRIATIAGDADGFIYLVSSMGVTGMRSQITTDVGALVEKIRAVTDTPVAIGFGISTPEQAKNMAGLADGAIVG